MSSFKTVLVVAAIPIALLVPVLLVKLAVSDKDPTLPTEHLRHYEVVVAEYYGVRLDEKARPQDVAYVLLKAIEDNFAAAEAPGRVAQLEGVRKARETQIACAAPDGILRDYRNKGLTIDDSVSEANRQKLILKAILPWAQKLGYYVGTFRLDSREGWTMNEQPAAGDRPALAVVRFQTEKKDSKVQVAVHLIKEKNVWRVYRVDVQPIVAKLTITPGEASTKPKPSTAPGKAAPKPAPTLEPSKAKAPAKPAPKPAAETKPAAKPAPKVSTPATKPAPKPAAKAPEKPAAKPVTKPAGASKPASK